MAKLAIPFFIWLALSTAIARGQAQRAIAKAQAQARETCRSTT